MTYEANKTSLDRAMAMLRANGVSHVKALDLAQQAERKKAEKVFGYGCWMIAHADGTWSSGAA